jgi:hypothetical protein
MNGGNGRLPIVRAPDGSSATYDRDATAAVYERIPASDCSCAGCRNYRAVWDARFIEDELAAVCTTMGIDPSKPRETVAYTYDAETNRAEYYGDLVFVGDVERRTWPYDKPTWQFNEGTRDYSLEFGPRYAAIWFLASLPWVLDEPPPTSR